MFTEKFKSLTSNIYFEKIVILVILVSAFMAGLSTYSVPEWIENFIYFFDISITVFFVIEIFIRFKAHKKILNFFKNGWNIFDLIIVIGSLIPLDGSEMVFLGRLLRIIRVLRLVSFLPELRTLVSILYRALPKIGNIVLLMFILFYIYAGFGSLLFSEINQNYWGDISISMLTLFRVLTLENWSEIMYETMAVYPISWMYYVSFIFITVFALINMMVGVVVEEFLTNTESKLIGRLENNQKLMRDNQKLMRDNQTKIINNQDEIHKRLDGIFKKLNGDL